MNWVGFVIAVIGIIAVGSLWLTIKLTRQVQELKRNEYYTKQKLKGVSKEILEALEPLRIQLSGVASGKPFPGELIRNGRLYWEVSTDEAEPMIFKSGDSAPHEVVVLDVRTPQEYAVKHISGARLVPLEELEKRFTKDVPADSGKVFVYCARGDRSRLACDFLSRQGYANLYNIRDGLQRWKGPSVGDQPVNLIQVQSLTKSK
jgi:rhodanese-related sulfurtransferase